MGIKHHHHHDIKESPCLHCSKSKKWQARLPLQCAATQPPTAAARRPVVRWPTSAVPARLAATPLLIRWPTPAKEELPVVTRPAAVPRGHVGPAPVVEETRRAVKGLVVEYPQNTTRHNKVQKIYACAAYIYQISILWFVHVNYYYYCYYYYYYYYHYYYYYYHYPM